MLSCIHIISVLCSVVLFSGVAVKKMIDCGAGVVDADCKLKLNMTNYQPRLSLQPPSQNFMHIFFK